MRIEETIMFINNNVANASESAEMVINELKGKKYSIDFILGRIRKLHIKGDFVKPDEAFNELDSIFDQLENLEKENLFNYLRDFFALRPKP